MYCSEKESFLEESSLGGGVGNRTRVRKQPTIGLYVRSSADRSRSARAQRPKLFADPALDVDRGSGKPRSKPS